MSASLSAIGSVPMSCAISASEVAITVESMFSMNRATARMRGTRRDKGLTAGGGKALVYHLAPERQSGASTGFGRGLTLWPETSLPASGGRRRNGMALSSETPATTNQA